MRTRVIIFAQQALELVRPPARPLFQELQQVVVELFTEAHDLARQLGRLIVLEAG